MRDGGQVTDVGPRIAAILGRDPDGGADTAEELGRGAQTVVYRIELDGQPYALKVLHSGSGEHDVVAFRREGTLLARLDHPGLPHVHEVGTVDDHHYLIMELVAGRPLSAVLRDGPVDERTAAGIGIDIARALTASHRVGLIHRDVKPENIMIGPDGHAKLIDFGLAARTGAAADDLATGTFAYSAPEQTGALHRPVDGRADLYALGVVLFEVVCGRVPFQSGDAAELIHLHLSTAPPELTDLRPDAGEGMAAVVRRLLAKDPDDRYQHATDLVDDLMLVADGGPVPAAVPAPDPLATPAGPLIGRDAEFGQLRTRWERALTGTGGTAVVTGPPGMGKGRLARELAVVARAGGHPVLTGTFPADSAVPLEPLRTAVDRYLTGGPDAVRRFLAAVRDAAGDAAGLLASLSPAVAAVLPATDLDTTALQEQFPQAVAALLARLAELHGGALIVLEDVHHADDLSRRVLARLTDLLPHTPLLVVLTAGDDGRHDPAGDLRLPLGPLDEAGLAELAAHELGVTGPAGAGAGVPAELVGRLLLASHGNPLAAEEYLRAVIDSGVVRPSWGAWILDGAALDRLDVPDNVLDLMLRRVDALGPDGRTALTVAAAVGNRFDPALIGRVGRSEDDDGEQELLAGLGEAVTGGLIEPVGDGYAFLHDRIRTALLAALDESGRQALHQRIAQTLDVPAAGDGRDVYAIARHYALGVPSATPERVYSSNVAAGLRALAEHAAVEALGYLQRAGEVVRTGAARPDPTFHTAIGTAALLTGEHRLAEEHLLRALDDETDQGRRAGLWRRLAMARYGLWEGRTAVDAIDSGLRELGERRPRSMVALIVTTLVRLVAGIVVGMLPERWRLATGPRRERYIHIARLSDCGTQGATVAAVHPIVTATYGLRALYAINRLGRGPEYAAVLSGLAVIAAATGMHSRATRMANRAIAAATDTGDPRLTARTHMMHAVCHDALAPMHGDSGERVMRALLTHGRWMDVSDYVAALAMYTDTLQVRGYATTTLEIVRSGVAGRRPPPVDEDASIPLAVGNALATALVGRAAEAARMLARLVEDTYHMGPAHHRNLAVVGLRLRVEEGETGAAFEEAVAGFDALGMKPATTMEWYKSAWVWRAFGRLGQAAHATADERAQRLAVAGRAVADLKRAANGPMLRAYHRVAEASLAQLRGADALALRTLAEAEASLVTLDAPIVEYEALRVRARALRAVGHPADVRRHASTALRLATDGGWATRARWIETEFALAGSVTSVRSSGGSNRTMAQPSGVTGLHQRRLEASYQVSLAATAILDPAELARVILAETVTLFSADRAFLFLHDPQADRLVPYLGRDADSTDLSELTGYGSTLVQRVADTAEAVVVTGTDEGVALGSQSAMVYGLRSIMVAPLLVKGRLLGVIYLDSRAARGVFTAADVELLTSITNHFAVSLETARSAQLELAVRAARRERDLAELLRGAVAELSATLDPDDVAQRLVAIVTTSLNAERACLLFTSDDGPSIAVCHGPVPGKAGDAGWLQQGGPARGSGPPPEPVAAVLGPDTRSWVTVPLTVRGEQRGLLVAGTAEATDGYTEAGLEIAAALADQGMVAYDNARLFRTVEDLAVHDGLTGLYNRRHFFELGTRQLRGADRLDRPLAAVMLDIDHFKKINDTYGHTVGDAVIREVAVRLRTGLRDSDLLCRYGGEEFAALLVEVMDDPESVCERVRAAVQATPVATDVGPVPVTVSIGVADLHPGHRTLQALLTEADNALYEAKRAGRNRVVSAWATPHGSPA